MAVENDASSSSSDMVGNNRNLSVLVVDDDSLLRMFHDSYLKHFGLETQVAEDGQEAVDLFHFGASYDLVLMDRDMPVMNGVEATKVLRAMGVTSLIVGLTARVPRREMEEFMEAGLSYCFEKPLSINMVNFLLKELNKINIGRDNN